MGHLAYGVHWVYWEPPKAEEEEEVEEEEEEAGGSRGVQGWRACRSQVKIGGCLVLMFFCVCVWGRGGLFLSSFSSLSGCTTHSFNANPGTPCQGQGERHILGWVYGTLFWIHISHFDAFDRPNPFWNALICLIHIDTSFTEQAPEQEKLSVLDILNGKVQHPALTPESSLRACNS